MDGENEPCPICKMDRYLNPQMTLLVSPCFHKMCESCINRIFSAGSAPCPTCGTILRKNNFVRPMFENMYVEKECRIRKRVWKIFNKRHEDFDGDLKAYNDYLEEVEEIVFNLVNDTDVQAMNARIEAYQRENQELIQRNLDKEREDEAFAKEALEEQKKEFLKRQEHDMLEARKQQQERQRRRDELIEQLAQGDAPAETIIESYSADSSSVQNHTMMEVDDDSKQPITPDRGLSLLQRMERIQREAAQRKMKPKNPFEDPLETPYEREEITVLDSYNDPASASFDTEAARAGGYSMQMVYQKALEAMSMALFVPPL